MSLTDWAVLFLIVDGFVTKLIMSRANGRMADRLLALVDTRASDAVVRLRSTNPVVREGAPEPGKGGDPPLPPLWTKDFGRDLPSDTRVDGA